MVLTVYQYIPVIEEENSNHIELAKKCKEGKETEEKDSNEADFDCLSNYKTNLIINELVINQFDTTYQNILCHFYSEINTPPPKI